MTKAFIENQATVFPTDVSLRIEVRMPFETRFSDTVLPLSSRPLIDIAFLPRLVTRSSIHGSSRGFKARVLGYAFQSIFDRYVACLASHLAILPPTSVRSHYFSRSPFQESISFSGSNQPVLAFVPYFVYFPSNLNNRNSGNS